MRRSEGLRLVGLEDDLTLLLGVSTHPPYRDRRHPGDGGKPVDGAFQGALVADRRDGLKRRGGQVSVALSDVAGARGDCDGDGEDRHGVDGDNDARHCSEDCPRVLGDAVEADDLRRRSGQRPTSSRYPPGQERPGPQQPQHRAQEGGGQ